MTDPGQPADRMSPRESRLLLRVLMVAGILMAWTVVPGVFIVDELNYLSTVVGIRNGVLTVPGTEGLPPSRELAAFDPEDQAHSITTTPVSTLAPPLYAFVALPFSYFGWNALFLLNMLAFLVTLWMIYVFVRDRGGKATTAGIATALFALGGFSLEYAYGMWPHMLSVAFTTGAFVAAMRVRTADSVWMAILAGSLVGWSVGIREQNIVIAGGIGLVLVIYSARRWNMSGGFLAGLIVPLLLIAWINSERVGVFHPFPKVAGFTADVHRSGVGDARDLFEPIGVLWAKVVDLRTHPPFQDELKQRLLRHDPDSGVPLVGSVVKKALLQSAPWAAAAFAVLLAGWWGRRKLGVEVRRDLGAIALTVVPLFAVIALAGFARSDGRAFNQRYLLELMPLFAMAAAFVVSAAGVALRPFAVSAVIGLILSVTMLVLFDHSMRYTLIATVPLALAAAVGGSTLMTMFSGRGSLLFTLALGCSLGWSLMIHAADDVRASLHMRQTNWAVAREIEPLVAPGSAIFAYWGGRDALGPLMLTRNALILDAWADDGAAAPELTQALLEKGTHVYVRTDGFPEDLLQKMIVGSIVDTIRTEPPRLLELRVPH